MNISNQNTSISSDCIATASPPITYAFPERALKGWAQEHLRLEKLGSKEILAHFQFRGTTCCNMGLALSFSYEVRMQQSGGRFLIVEGRAYPTRDEEGWESMCAYIDDAEFPSVLGEPMPLVGEALERIIEWDPEITPSGCLCTTANRNHKWRLVLQTIHYAVTNQVS